MIVVTHNSEGTISLCLRRLLSQERVTVDVVVVDNGSVDGTLETVREAAPEARIIEMGENSGFCRANNVGIRLATADAVLLLNPDVYATSTFVVGTGSGAGGRHRCGGRGWEAPAGGPGRHPQSPP